MTPPDTLLQFPCAFPVKVMGRVHPDLLPAVIELCRAVDATFDEASVLQRPSANGTFVGLTLTIQATSREQLDGLYRALSAHPRVAFVL
jgi:putative lipoic acid-binding regulatory protein